VRTKSGATAVQLVEYVDDRHRRVVAHVGSAHDEVELGVLMEQGRSLLAEYTQPELGFETMPVLRTTMVPAPAPSGLVPADIRPVRRELVEPAGVLATFSGLLYEVIGNVYDDVGFGAVKDQVFKDLVIAQIVEPTSLFDVDRVLTELGQTAASLSTRNRTLSRCVSGAYRSTIARACFKHASTRGDVSLVLYDVTTLRTQAEKADDFRIPGYSKERSVDPQIVVGLLVDREGFPLEIACFEGNKAEKLTIIPVLDGFKARHSIDHMVIAADAGMLSAANLKALDDAGYQFIVGSRATKAPIDLESHFSWHGQFLTDGHIVDTVTPKIGMNVDNDTNQQSEPVWDPQRYPSSWRAIWQYSAKRFVHDNHMLDLQHDRAQAVVDGVKAAHKPRFVQKAGGVWRVDTASLTRARAVAGLKGYVTNMPVTVMSPEEIIASYHDLWHVEQSFRISKNDLAARPFFASTRDSIEAHLTIVFAALAVTRTMQKRTGLALRRILHTLRPLRSAVIRINGTIRTLPPALNPDQQTLIDQLKTADMGH